MQCFGPWALLISLAPGCYAAHGSGFVHADDAGAPQDADADASAGSGDRDGAGDGAPDSGATYCADGWWGGGEWTFEPVALQHTDAVEVDRLDHGHVLAIEDGDAVHYTNDSGAWTSDPLGLVGSVLGALAIADVDTVHVLVAARNADDLSLHWLVGSSGALEDETALTLGSSVASSIAIASGTRDLAGAVVESVLVPGAFELHVGRRSGSGWEWDQVPLQGEPRTGSLVVAIDHDDAAHIAYFVGDELEHLTDSGGQWVFTVVDAQASGTVSLGAPALGFDSEGRAVLGYAKDDGLAVARVHDGHAESAVTAHPYALAPEDGAVRFDALGVLHFAGLLRSEDIIFEQMVFTRWEWEEFGETGWITFGSGAPFSTSSVPFIAFGPPCCREVNARPYVSYYDEGALRYGVSRCSL